jgi:PAS domain-containing protein
VAKDAGVNEEDCRTLELLAVLLSSAVSVAAEREARREQVEALVRFETIFEQAPIGIGLVSLDGRLVNTNSVMRDISGRSAEELASRNVGEYTVPEDVDSVVEPSSAGSTPKSTPIELGQVAYSAVLKRLASRTRGTRGHAVGLARGLVPREDRDTRGDGTVDRDRADAGRGAEVRTDTGE